MTQYASGYSIRTIRYRYSEWGPNGRDGAELYDHRSDPEELVNLASRPDHVETVQRLSRWLHRRIDQARRAPVGLRRTAAKAKSSGQGIPIPRSAADFSG